MIKAVVIIIACLFGIRFYCKSKFLHASVIVCLLAAITVVSLVENLTKVLDHPRGIRVSLKQRWQRSEIQVHEQYSSNVACVHGFQFHDCVCKKKWSSSLQDKASFLYGTNPSCIPDDATTRDEQRLWCLLHLSHISLHFRVLILDLLSDIRLLQIPSL